MGSEETSIAGAIVSLSDGSARTGRVAGAGAQYALTNRWSVGVEDLHVDLGSTKLNLPGVTVTGVAFNPASASFTDRSDIVRGRIDYRFNLGGPVVAKY